MEIFPFGRRAFLSAVLLAAPDHLVEAVDPLHARREADGTIIAPIIGFAEASRLYTARM
jgi:hypothetical protein